MTQKFSQEFYKDLADQTGTNYLKEDGKMKKTETNNKEISKLIESRGFKSHPPHHRIHLPHFGVS